MTLEGTNTWLLHAGPGRAVVVDPGPEHAGHHARRARRRRAGRGAGRAWCSSPTATPTTPRAPRGSPPGPAGCRCGRWTRGTASARRGSPRATWSRSGTWSCRSSHTPGHTSDSVSLLVPGDDGPLAVLTGDTVLGRGTTVVAHPDGELGPYLDSLRRLADAGRRHRAARARAGPAARRGRRPRRYLAHREQRLAPGPGRRGGRGAPTPGPWWRSSTPTSTARCGRPRSSASAPSWPTWACRRERRGEPPGGCAPARSAAPSRSSGRTSASTAARR